MREFLTLTKAMSDETRLRTLMLLQERELCVCQIIEMLGLAPSTVSKHMTILLQAGLVKVRKNGKWHYYRLPGQDAPWCVQQALGWMRSALIESPDIAEDAKRLKAVMEKDVVSLCGCYRQRLGHSAASARVPWPL